MVTPSEVLVGLGERTDESGYTSLSGLLAGDRAVTPIRLTGSVLHLDVALNLLGLRLGVIHRPSVLGDLPPSLGDVEWIEVTDEEFAEQAVNVTSREGVSQPCGRAVDGNLASTAVADQMRILCA